MRRLRDYPWWPTVWFSPTGWYLTHEVIRGGIFRNSRRVAGGLSLEVEHEGIVCTATIESSNISQENVILLRHILLQHCGEEMRLVADLNIDFRRPAAN